MLLNYQPLESIAAERFKVAPVTPTQCVSALFRNKFHSFWESQILQLINNFLPMRSYSCCLYVITFALKAVPHFSSNLVAEAAIRLAARTFISRRIMYFFELWRYWWRNKKYGVKERCFQTWIEISRFEHICKISKISITIKDNACMQWYSCTVMSNRMKPWASGFFTPVWK